jgi:hypothetical protein
MNVTVVGQQVRTPLKTRALGERILGNHAFMHSIICSLVDIIRVLDNSGQEETIRYTAMQPCSVPPVSSATFMCHRAQLAVMS